MQGVGTAACSMHVALERIISTSTGTVRTIATSGSLFQQTLQATYPGFATLPVGRRSPRPFCLVTSISSVVACHQVLACWQLVEGAEPAQLRRQLAAALPNAPRADVQAVRCASCTMLQCCNAHM